MIQAKQSKRKNFKWSRLKPLRNIFFIFYVFCLIGASIILRRQFLNPVLDPLRETLGGIFEPSAYLPESIPLEVDREKISFWHPVSDKKITAFRMMIAEQNFPYSFIIAIDQELRIIQIQKVKFPELIPKILFRDEELFFLSLEGRRAEDLPVIEGEASFKARFLSKLKKIMMAHSDHETQMTASNFKND